MFALSVRANVFQRSALRDHEGENKGVERVPVYVRGKGWKEGK